MGKIIRERETTAAYAHQSKSITGIYLDTSVYRTCNQHISFGRIRFPYVSRPPLLYDNVAQRVSPTWDHGVFGSASPHSHGQPGKRMITQRRISSAAAPAFPFPYGPQKKHTDKRLSAFGASRDELPCAKEIDAELADRNYSSAQMECENGSGFPATLRLRDKHARRAGTHLLSIDDAPSPRAEFGPFLAVPPWCRKTGLLTRLRRGKSSAAKIEENDSWQLLLVGPADIALVALADDIERFERARSDGVAPSLDIWRSFEGRVEWCGNFHEKGPQCVLPAHRAMEQ